MINNQFPFDESQLIISFELLHLLDWLVKNDPESIKKLVENAQKNGYQETHGKQAAHKRQAATDLRESISSFFLLLEESLLEKTESTDPYDTPTSMPASIVTTVESIDSSLCDTETLTKSTERTKRALKQNTEQNPRELFYRELLKNWKPRKKSLFH